MITNLKRYPSTNNKSLRAWNAADELLLKYILENDLKTLIKQIYNDAFGFLTVNLCSDNTFVVTNNLSQEIGIKNNLEINNFQFDSKRFIKPLQNKTTKIDLGIIKIPKTIDLFELYLNDLSKTLNKNGVVICGFMTRHFSKNVLEVASKYFEIVEQSRAEKKARLLILKNKKPATNKQLIHSIEYKNQIYKQYFGVFSSGNIDYATQFLIDHIQMPSQAKNVLDLASGNGVLAKQVQMQNSNANIYLLDDSYLAIESSKLNISGDNIKFVHHNALTPFEADYFDYIISNPPFHIEHEIDLILPLNLFKQAFNCLKPEGVFQLVYNNHLNYLPHLQKLFSSVTQVAKNDKFTVLNCTK